MKNVTAILVMATMVLLSCSEEKSIEKLIDESLSFSVRQYTLMYAAVKDRTGQLPFTINGEGELITSGPDWWTSGFFPGSLWYFYEYSNDDKIREAAEDITFRLEQEKYNTGTHDLGFMLYCSYGNGLRLTIDELSDDKHKANEHTTDGHTKNELSASGPVESTLKFIDPVEGELTLSKSPGNEDIEQKSPGNEDDGIYYPGNTYTGNGLLEYELSGNEFADNKSAEIEFTDRKHYFEILLTGARSLITRYRPGVGCIQSWNSSADWQCPVIIDNMMNLEYLLWAFEATGDSIFLNICVNHSDTTIRSHFRDDFSSFHVVSYDTITGRVEKKQTHQGAADESVWARGQSWGLYGYTVMYRTTGYERYLRQAMNIADFLIDHPNMPVDMIPYWDYEAPGIPDTPRDASAGAIMASALVELSSYAGTQKGRIYLEVAEKQIRSLASPDYRAGYGENGNFILIHSVGSFPEKKEVDVPLIYADYYFIEALMRYRNKLNRDI